MKKIYTFLLALATSVTMLNAEIIEDVRIGYLNYNLDTESLTAEVTSIYYAYYGNLYSLDIPSSVTFEGQSYSVTSIGDKAFSGCSALTSVTMPNSVTNIGEQSFSCCYNLTSITIGNGVTGIGESAFGWCYELANLEIPDNVIEIGDFAFHSCKGLTTVTFGNSLEKIGYKAFYECSNLTSIFIPQSVNSISTDAFGYCKNLTSIEVESGNQVYDSRDNCNAIIKTSSNTLITGCKTTIVVNGVERLGDCAFSGCSDLTSINLPDGITSLGDFLFEDCGLTSINIPQGVLYIGNYTFENCINLTSITIPKSVESILMNPVYKCSNLTSIVVEEGNPVFDSRDNCNAIIETASNTLISGCKNTIIPDGVTHIQHVAFGQCIGLTSIAIPKSVTTLDAWVFMDCSNLTTIYNYAKTPQPVDSEYDPFYKFDKAACTLYVPEASIDKYKSADGWKDFAMIIAIPGTEVESEGYNINYLNKSGGVIDSELVTLSLPIAPEIEGFTFLRWDVVAGQLSDGINIQAVYTADEPTDAPEVANPANKSQKLIRNGNVYILTDTKTYTIHGQEVK